ncbi:FAD-dependent monooxygenase [Streptomyces lavendulocolor]
MPSGRPAKALVIGAGIGGLTCAVALKRVDVDVEVYERATELREAGAALAVMSNAVTALAALDIDLGLDERGRAVESFTIADRRGRRIRDLPFGEVCDRVGARSFCLSRADLQQALLSQLADCPLHMGATADGFETDDEGVTVRFRDGRSARGDVLIGADGFNSAVRRHLVGPEKARDSGYHFQLGIVPFRHPALPPGGVRQYWGDGQRFALIDLGHGRCYWWANMSNQAPAPDRVKEALEKTYGNWADEVRGAIEATPQEDILIVPSHDRPHLEQWGDGPITLLGDAAHPMLTTLAQGAGMAIEDAVVLAGALSESATDGDPVSALRAYERRRRDRTRTMVTESRLTDKFQQAAGPLRTSLRDIRFRLTPRRVLAQQLTRQLTFPHGPQAAPYAEPRLDSLELR